jgi:hypothetical protein
MTLDLPSGERLDVVLIDVSEYLGAARLYVERESGDCDWVLVTGKAGGALFGDWIRE